MDGMTSPSGPALARERSADWARAWRKGDAFVQVAAAFDAVPATDPDAVAGVATRILQGKAAADLIAPMIRALTEDCWFEPPLRASRDSARIGAVLFDHPAVVITASVLSAAALAAMPAPVSVAVSGKLTIVHYLRAGGARLRLWTAEPAGPDFRQADAMPLRAMGDVKLAVGMTLRLDGRTRGSLIADAESDVVTVTAVVRAGAAPFQREYRLSDGMLERIATLDDGAARTQMLLTYLRHAGRADAGPWFDAATRDGAFFLRWAAMREWLALDATAALPRLRAMTGDDNAEVRMAAAETLPVVEAACQF
jgi:hypothetical protein